MKTLIGSFLLFFGMILFSGITEAALTFELLGGSVYNVPQPLLVHQSGQETIRLCADYETKPFEFPLYYDVRIAVWSGKTAWELEFIHHKLYLMNNPPEIQNFSLSHGYNLLMVNRAWRLQKFMVRCGTGIAVTHPETIIRNRKYPETKGLFRSGYYISGPVTQFGIGKEFHIWQQVRFVIEGKITYSYSRISVRDGNADVLNLAVHGLTGIKYSF